MSPAWALEGGGATPQPLHPPRTGLVARYKGDFGLEGSGGLATAWLDSTAYHQDINQFDVGRQPLIGTDDIDGVPCMSFPTAGIDTYLTYLYTTVDMVDRLSNPFTSGPRTIVSVCRPVTGVFGWCGGGVFTWLQGTIPVWGAKFLLRDGDARVWTDQDRSTETKIVGGLDPLVYNGVPTLVQWQTTTYPNLTVRVNDVVQPLTQGQVGGPPHPSGGAGGFFIGNNDRAGFDVNFLGSIAETLIYDWSIDAATQEHLTNYVRATYPSVPLA